MTGNTFPPIEIPEMPLDEAQLAQLVEAALEAAVLALAQAPVDSQARDVTRPRPDGFETQELPGPAYGAAIWKE